MRGTAAIAATALAFTVGAAPAYRFHLPAGVSQSSYERACASAKLRALVAVPYGGRRYQPAARGFRCRLTGGSAAAGWTAIRVQGTWRLPIGARRFPVVIRPAGQQAVAVTVDACFGQPCTGKNRWRRTLRQSGPQWSVAKVPASTAYSGVTAQQYTISFALTPTALTNLFVDADTQCQQGEPVTSEIHFDRIPVAGGRFAASSASGGRTVTIQGRLNEATITGTLRVVTATCDSGAVSFSAEKQ